MPEEVWSCGHSVRVLDVSNNLIRDVPTKVGDLKLLNVILFAFFCPVGSSCLVSLELLISYVL